jgi:hypothetical protein
MAITASQALQFVEAVELPPEPREPLVVLEDTAKFDFDKAKTQALVVGSDIVSFVKGVTEEQRRDIVNSALLAQLVAKKRVPDASNLFEWYDAYFEALENVGWVTQTRQFVKHVEQAINFEAHEAIMKVAASLLGPGAAALPIIKATLDALKNMNQNSPWITLFNRESQHASTARFQVTLAEEGAAGQFLVTLMAFGLKANATLTQVLFFKFRSNDVELTHSSGKVTINAPVLAAVRSAIEQKLAAHATKYIRGLPDLD